MAWLPRLAIPAACSLLGCSDSEVGTADHRADKSGFLDTIPAVRVATEPAMTIGLDPEDDSYVLVSVAWAAISGDSVLIVGDASANRVGVYGIDGVFRRWIGGVGEGPGEFRQPSSGGLTSGGDVWVSDLRRVLVYRPDGTVLHTIAPRLRSDITGTRTLLGVDGDLAVWMKTVQHYNGRLPDSSEWPRIQPGERYRSRVSIRRIAEGSSSIIWSGEGDEVVYDEGPDWSGGQTGILAPRLLTTLVGDELVLTRTETTLLEAVTVDGTVESWLSYSAPDVLVGDRYPSIAGAHRYDLMPKALEFFPGEPGSGWLAIRHPTHPFDSPPPLVHMRAGAAIEYLVIPPPLSRPLFVGDRWGAWTNLSELGEQSVSIYELIR